MGAQDPRTKFKTSDYEKQEQELPGLQSELTPQPDCGETSYEGHNRLLDYKMLVTGMRLSNRTCSSDCICQRRGRRCN